MLSKLYDTSVQYIQLSHRREWEESGWETTLESFLMRQDIWQGCCTWPRLHAASKIMPDSTIATMRIHENPQEWILIFWWCPTWQRHCQTGSYASGWTINKRTGTIIYLWWNSCITHGRMNQQGNPHLKSLWGIVQGQRSLMWLHQFPPLPYGFGTGKEPERMCKNSWSRCKRNGPKGKNWNKGTKQVTKYGWKGTTYELISHQPTLPRKDMDPSRLEKPYHLSHISWNFLHNGRSMMSSM